MLSSPSRADPKDRSVPHTSWEGYHVNSSWTRSVFDQFEETRMFLACACGACCCCHRGQRLWSAVPCAVAWLCACRVLFLVQFPVASGISATGVRCHLVRDTPDDSSRRLMAQEKRFTLLPYLTFTAGQGCDWKRLSQETYPQRLIV